MESVYRDRGASEMIPKIIHYCWFGRGEKSKLAEKCIASWKKYCPDYQIIEWNEDNFDIKAHDYAKSCYEQGKWAFLSDYVRLIVVEQQGGIYFDTDVELLRNPDDLLDHEAFYGFENNTNINTGQGFGAEAHHITLRAMVEQYMKLQRTEEGTYPCIICPQLNTQALVPLGLELNGQRQSVCGAEIYPVEYFNPYESATGQLNKTRNTVSVHWYSKSWMSKGMILRSVLTRPFHRVFGVKCFDRLKYLGREKRGN
ncbi:glycosyltransferase [Pseudoflavonifractor sp. SW1122]|uniref:glycosyltransferase family 32 protein n=1 Tax=Pseudoflavonifractor sp. SW1122 TaxID=2530044 RepID=UPI00325BBE1E